MKKINLIIISILVLLSCKTRTNTPVVKYQPVVLDYAGLFSKSQKDSLSQKIITYETISTNEICVYTIDSLPKNTAVHSHATTLANTLGVGKKEKDNGLLILISKYDRDIAIATGYGTEQLISDYDCKNVIDNTMVPHFKKGDFFQGTIEAIDALIILWQE
ncbi:TPM domain-containing protein [Hyunsoonleella sp. 2307UL5-6]|uniref:TPM domain-containing protein n=1 Tax=Hyunsoonleella sp. 2307UL5-6 TaxID=3384768 RepID=UPI0039BD5698